MGEVAEHVCHYEKDIILALDHIKDIGKDTKSNKEAILGNGKPGMITRLSLNEQSIRTLTKFQWVNTLAILSATAKFLFFGG